MATDLIEITYEATFEDDDSECFALEVTKAQLKDRALLRELILDDLESRWMPDYDDWPEGDVVRIAIEVPDANGWMEL